MKQTAVEWLIEQIQNEKYIEDIDFEQAKVMERELIKDSCTMAIMQWHEWDKTNYLDLYDHKIEGAEIWSEDYVKELYGEIEVPEPKQETLYTEQQVREAMDFARGHHRMTDTQFIETLK
jgi:hypothetical protein